jgi:hypothetical protein
MKYYKVTKIYRGGSSTYYIALNNDEEITEDMLESIGENTSGGENYGYSMHSRKIKALPKGAKVLSRQCTVVVY